MGLFSKNEIKEQNQQIINNNQLNENDFKQYMANYGLDFDNTPISQELLDEYLQALHNNVLDDVKQNKRIEIHVPSIRSMTDKLMVAKYGVHLVRRTEDAMRQIAEGEGIDTIWTISYLTFGDEACSIELGARLIPYKLVDCVLKHPSFDENDMTYGVVLKNGDIINFRFTDHVQRDVALQLFNEHIQ